LPEIPDLESLHVWPCPHPHSGTEAIEIQTAPAPGPHAGGPTARAPTPPRPPVQRSDPPAAPPVSTTMMRLPSPGSPGRDPDKKVPRLEPIVLAPNSTKDSREQVAKLLGVSKPKFGAPNSPASPPDAQAFGPVTPTPSQRLSATSALGGA
jgi:hypothetical protein